MDENLDLIRFGNRITIKDLNQDLDISDRKWDFVFEYLLSETAIVYFEGFRLWVEDEDFIKNINYLADQVLVNNRDYFIFLCKIKPGFITINRGLLNTMWEYYEYPSLIFLKDENQEQKLVEICNQLPLAKEKITEALNGVFIARRGGHPDVLWVEKSSDVNFPWHTTRSPRAIEREESRSWFTKFLNSLGFYWDIKINRKEE